MIELRYLCHHRFTASVKGDRYHGLVSVARKCPDRESIDTGRTEGDLNGWRITRAP